MAVAAKRAHANGTLQDPRGRGNLWTKRWPTDRRVAGLFPLFTVAALANCYLPIASCFFAGAAPG